MKKILLALLFIPTLAGAAQQEITVVPDNPVIPSIGSLKDAINLRLADIDENFDEIYPILTAGPVYVNTTAPADTKVVWIDTDQDNAIKVYIGGVWTVVGTAGSGDNLGSAAYSDVVALWTTCTGYLKSDGTCDTPSGSATYPSAAGVANWNGSAWGTSYTVGTAANNLVQLNASAQLPAVSADLLTITDTGSYFTTDTVGAALQELGGAPELLFGTEFTETAGTGTVTLTLDNPVTVEAWSGSGWDGDTQGATRNDIYDYLVNFDADGDGSFLDEAWFPSGAGYTNLTQFQTQTPWRLFYANGDGDVTELAIGASGTVLQSNGATSAPTWATPTGGSYPEGYMEIDGGDSTSTTFAGVIDGGASI